MENMTAGKIAAAVGGQILWGDPLKEVADICIDSRRVKPGDLYVPIIGERVDGHRFIPGAIAAGAAAVFTSEGSLAESLPDGSRPGSDGEDASLAVWIAVEDTRRALQKLGGYCRDRLAIPIVGVTGSVGKTSTRSMIAAALSAGFRTFQTEGNANSQVGTPIMLSRITGAYEAAVIELGMSEPGEMTRIASIARPDIAVMTNIGISHIEQLGSQAGILREKLHITDGMGPTGRMILNGDDPYLNPQAHPGAETVKELTECTARFPAVYYGLEEGSNYRACEIHAGEKGTAFTLVCEKGRVPVELGLTGLHHVRNALAALAAADLLGVDLEAAARALGEFAGVAHRQEKIEFPQMGLTVIDDSYNASPDSMRAAIDTLRMTEAAGRKVAVLADMWELGSETRRYHREVGEYLGKTDVSVLVTVGELAREIAAGALSVKQELTWVGLADYLEAGSWLDDHREEGDLILLKGSNGMKLFEITEQWKKRR